MVCLTLHRILATFCRDYRKKKGAADSEDLQEDEKITERAQRIIDASMLMASITKFSKTEWKKHMKSALASAVNSAHIDDASTSFVAPVEEVKEFISFQQNVLNLHHADLLADLDVSINLQTALCQERTDDEREDASELLMSLTNQMKDAERRTKVRAAISQQIKKRKLV